MFKKFNSFSHQQEWRLAIHNISVDEPYRLYSGFTKEELNKIFSSSKFEIKEYGEGQIIHLQNDICHTMDIVLNGKKYVQLNILVKDRLSLTL